MKHCTILIFIALFASIHAHAKKLGDSVTKESFEDDQTDSEKQVASTPTFAQAMDDAIREIMNEFSHMTSLHESLNFVPHPFFSRPRFGLLSGEDPSASSASGSSGRNLSPWGTFPGSLTRWSPRYEVVDDSKTFQVSLDVPGFHFHEMKVDLEAGGRVLSIVGTKEENVHETTTLDSEGGETHKEKHEEGDEHDGDEDKIEFSSHTSTSFQQKFTLDPSVDTTKITANLVNGKLVVRAPRKYENIWGKKHIPITQFDDDVWADLISKDEDESEEA